MKTCARSPIRIIPPSSSCSASATAPTPRSPVARALIARPAAARHRACRRRARRRQQFEGRQSRKHAAGGAARSDRARRQRHAGRRATISPPSPRRWHDPAIGIVTCLYKGVPTGGLWSRARRDAHQFRLSAGRAGRRRDRDWAAAALARRSRCGARCWSESAGSPGCATNWPTTTGWGGGARARARGRAVALYRRGSRVASRPSPACGGTSCAGRAPRGAMAPAGFAGSVVTHTGGARRAGAALVCEFGSAACTVSLGSLLLRWAIGGGDRALRSALPRARPWLLPVRDVLSFAVFLASFCGRNVLWRDQSFRVEPSGRMTPSKGTSRYDEDPVPAPAVVRRLRRRRGLALSGEARDPLVLVSDLAGPAGGAGSRQQADRRAAGAARARRRSAAGRRLRARRDAHLDARPSPPTSRSPRR